MLDPPNSAPFTESMRNFGWLALVGLFTALTQSSAPAQEKPPAASEAGASKADAKVVSIYESRNFSAKRDTTSGSLAVEVEVGSDVKNAELLRVEVTSAKDDKGTDLLDPKRAAFDAEQRLLRDSGPTARLRFEVPARDATAVAEIVGTAVFQDETKAVKPVEIKDFRKTPAEYLENATLEKFKIAVAYLDKESFDGKGEAFLLEGMELSTGLAKADDETMKGALSMFRAVFDLPNVTAIMVKDPEENMLRLEGVAADGKASFHAQNLHGGLWMLHATSEETDLAAVRIHIKSKAAEFTRELVLKGVKLP
jgi:hypothetical protein